VNGPLTIIDSGAQRIESIGLTEHTKALLKCGPRMCAELESLAWSPDGKTLSYGAGSIVAPHPQDGLHLLNLASGKSVRVGSAGDWFDLAWSRDGAKLAYVSDGTIFIIRTAQPQRPATPLRIAGQADGVTVTGVNASPAWSANDRTIAYASAPKGEGSSGIYLVNLDGSHERRLAQHGFAPAWSPDGSRIAYSVRCGIRLVTPTGRNVTPPSAWKCAHIGVAGSPAWSPDGRKIAVAGKSGIYVMNADGSLLRRFWTAQPDTPFGLWRARPAWRPIPR
jgi:Tol biopolymer transport system component